MSQKDGGGEGRLDERLLAADGLDDREAVEERKGTMRDLVREERLFTARLRRSCFAAWAASLLLPVGYIARAPVEFMVATRGGTDPLSGWMLVYFGAQLLTFVGGAAALIGVVTLAAWLFRYRRLSVAALQARVVEIEETLARLQSRRG